MAETDGVREQPPARHTMHRFANPNRVLRLSSPTDAVAVRGDGHPAVARRPLSCAVRIAAGLSAGRERADHVRPRAVRVDGAVLLQLHGGGVGRRADLAHPLAELAAKATAPIGACFTFLALVTGSLWGKPMWGTWWVWDARLTSVLVLFFLYLGYIALVNAFDDPGARHAGRLDPGAGRLRQRADHQVLGRLVEHPAPAGQRRCACDGPAIDPSMLAPLLVMALAFTSYYFWVVLLRLSGEILAGKIRALRLRQVHG